MNNYEKIRLVGRGAYGTVFLCNRISDNQRVILKEIPVEQMSVDERQVSVNEAKVLSMLDHPNIVGYYESILEEKIMTIVMEYVQGGTLFDYLKQRNGVLLDEKEVLHYFCQMVYTLQYVHSKQILHRDLKSQNILLNTDKYIVKIGDFGISKVLTSKSKAYTVVGTPCYISPELCEGKPYNQKSDIWALGCILYELMTMKRPFDANTLPALVMKIMKGSFDPVPDIYSSELKTLLVNMLHLDPNQRPNVAHIMCQPFLIPVVFKLYVDIGSIPCKNESVKQISAFNSGGVTSSSRSETVEGSKLVSHSKDILRDATSVWLCCGSSSEVTLLPSLSKGVVKSIALGHDQKMGLTSEGLVVSWQVSTPYISIQDEDSNQEFIKSPSYAATIMDEKFAVNIASIACGENFTVCRSESGVIFTFGKTSSGCLGHSSAKDISELRIIEALFSHNIVSIACGTSHVIAVSDEGKVFAWGNNSHGCLGIQKIATQTTPIEVKIQGLSGIPQKVFCGPDCSFIVTNQNVHFACGSNRHNKLALDTGEGQHIDESSVFVPVCLDPLSSCQISQVSSGKSHSVFLCSNNELYSVGSNQYYQLGWGQSGVNYSMPGKVEKPFDCPINLVSCGDFYTLAVTSDHSLYGWGQCPKSLKPKTEAGVLENLSHFSNKEVLLVACGSKNLMVLTKKL